MKIFFACFALLAQTALAADDEINFEYVGSVSPDDWGKLSIHCLGLSEQQSPINLIKSKQLRPHNSTLLDMNKWHDVRGFKVPLSVGKFKVQAGPWDSKLDKMGPIQTVFNGTAYDLQQIHFHTPSGMHELYSLHVTSSRNALRAFHR